MRNEANGQTNNQDSDPTETFESLYRCVGELLVRFGQPNFLSGKPYGDYSVHGDYNNSSQIVVFISTLKMLQPSVVFALQHILKGFPGWEIDLRVVLWDHLRDWPEMNVRILSDQIVDGLQRQYFPKEFQTIQYEGATQGTAHDQA